MPGKCAVGAVAAAPTAHSRVGLAAMEKAD
jgi:hypothetical protein